MDKIVVMKDGVVEQRHPWNSTTAPPTVRRGFIGSRR
jgi:hypothetical protein